MTAKPLKSSKIPITISKLISVTKKLGRIKIIHIKAKKTPVSIQSKKGDGMEVIDVITKINVAQKEFIEVTRTPITIEVVRDVTGEEKVNGDEKGGRGEQRGREGNSNANYRRGNFGK